MMELEVYKKSDFYEDYIDSKKEYYERSNADAYFAERLSEKDAEIVKLNAENKLLKEHIANGDVSRITWIDEVIELKQKLDEKESWVKMLSEGEAVLSLELEKTKKKLENVQASMYADVVDANMENRRLRRALWLARDRSAHNAAMMWEVLSDECLIVSLFTIEFRCIGDPDVTEFQMFRTCIDWMKIYKNAEHKCRAKAEEYK